MADHYPAFDISPVPTPALDAEPPEVYQGIYGMPMFVTVPTTDLAASADFWIRGLGFIDLFTIPGKLTHLRRWAFQDTLLVARRAPPPSPRVVAVRLDSMTNAAADDAVAPDGLTVGVTASLVGVTVRTLHHWDALGLVRPSERTTGGYRLYSAADVARIHRVLIYRELGLPLDGIGGLLDAPAIDATVPLRQQRAQLVERISGLHGMVNAVDRMIEATNAGILLSAEEQVAIFGNHWQPSWVAEARDCWGDTAQWAQYAERVAGRTAEDWRQIEKSTSALTDDLAAAKRAGVSPGSTEGNTLAERHRASIGTYFDCTRSMHVCLDRKYVADPGFAAYYDAIEPGLTSWLRDIIDANARDRGIDPEAATWT